MSDLIKTDAHNVEPVPSSVSERMQWLCKFGEPSISRMRSGWWARIEMNTNTTGAKFQVDTEMKHGTIDEAVDQLIHRMIEALVMLGAWDGQP